MAEGVGVQARLRMDMPTLKEKEKRDHTG